MLVEPTGSLSKLTDIPNKQLYSEKRAELLLNISLDTSLWRKI